MPSFGQILSFLFTSKVNSQLSQGFLSKLRIIRQAPAAGLIRSKQRGADAAKGDASRLHESPKNYLTVFAHIVCFNAKEGRANKWIYCKW